MAEQPLPQQSPGVWVILVTGLGFFVDSFDVFSYNVIRMPSLADLGLSGDALTAAGMRILNWQVFGTLLGGFFWGLLGDRIGRKRALLGSILVYSMAMLANGFVQDVHIYAAIRFLVGFGIAGEVGLAATLVAEILPKEKRTFGLAFLTVFGLLGVAAAAFGSEFIHWRGVCWMGGMGGLILLGLRGLLLESSLFTALPKGDGFLAPLRTLVSTPRHAARYVGCIFLLAPSFFVTGVLLTLAPEIGKALTIAAPVKANIMLAGYFVVAVFGDLFGAFLSRNLQSRRHAIAFYMAGNVLIGAVYLFVPLSGSVALYGVGAAFGLFNLWALSATVAVEQFPTQLRATVSTSVLNFARAMIIFFNVALLVLKPLVGLLPALGMIGAVVFGTGLLSALLLRETYHADMDNVRP